VALTVLVVSALVLFFFPPVHLMDVAVMPDNVRTIAIELAIFSVIGAAMLIACASDLWRRRDAESLLLFLWVVGTFIFAAFLNWTVNARSVLPMAPAIIIVFMRRLDSRLKPEPIGFESRVTWPLVGAAAVSLIVAFADLGLANAGRTGAYVIHEKTKQELGAIWFEGHWGFQFYMEDLGAKPLDVTSGEIYGGDFLVMPNNSPNVDRVPTGTSLKSVVTVGSTSWISTMNRIVGAGFYASDWGPLPFSVGSADPERYGVFIANRRLHFHIPPEALPPGVRPKANN